MAGILSTILAYGVAAPICLFGGIKSLVKLPDDYKSIKNSEGAWKTSCGVVDLVGDVGKGIGGISAPVALWISGACNVPVLDDFSLAFEGKPDKIKLDNNEKKIERKKVVCKSCKNRNKTFAGLTESEIIELKKLLKNVRNVDVNVDNNSQAIKSRVQDDDYDDFDFDDALENKIKKNVEKKASGYESVNEVIRNLG